MAQTIMVQDLKFMIVGNERMVIFYDFLFLSVIK